MPEKKPLKRLSKSQLIATVVNKAEGSLTKKQVAAVFDALNMVVTQQLGKKGPGEPGP